MKSKMDLLVELKCRVLIKDADNVIVAVGHNEVRVLSMLQLKQFFKSNLKDEDKVLIDVKSLYRIDELKAHGMIFWRL